MSDFKKSQPINASADECYRALADVFRQMEIDILSTDGVARSMQGHFEGKGMGNKFSIEAVCAPSGGNASEVTLSFEKFTVRNNEKADLIFIALRRALGMPGSYLDIDKVEEEALQTFSASEQKGFKNKTQWRVMLTQSTAVFYDPETERTLTIPRENSWSQIVFIKNSGIMGTTEGTIATVAGVNMDMGTHKGLLLSWFPPKTKNDLKKELRNWGIGLIIVGVASILLSEYLDYSWGIGLIVIGIINLFIVHRAMFLINGLVMIVAGFFNIISVISSGFSYFFIFGIMQIGWGIGEFRKFGIYRDTAN